MPAPLSDKEKQKAKTIIYFSLRHLHKNYTCAQLMKQFDATDNFLRKRLPLLIQGKTLKEYLRDKRMYKAVKQLKRQTPVKEIAYGLGYSSPAAFLHAFKDYYGTYPDQYLKNCN